MLIFHALSNSCLDPSQKNAPESQAISDDLRATRFHGPLSGGVVITALPAGVKNARVPSSFTPCSSCYEKNGAPPFIQPPVETSVGVYLACLAMNGSKDNYHEFPSLNHSNRRSAAVRHQYLPIPHRPNTTFFLWYFSRIFASLCTSWPSSHSPES